MNAYMNQYQNTAVSTASPEQILIMLYDGAIRFVDFAAEAIAEKDHPKKTKYINKASAIINEFMATLDHEVGGEIAADLEALYDFMIRELAFANSRNDAQKLSTVGAMLKDLREGWMQAAESVRRAEQEEVSHEGERRFVAGHS